MTARARHLDQLLLLAPHDMDPATAAAAATGSASLSPEPPFVSPPSVPSSTAGSPSLPATPAAAGGAATAAVVEAKIGGGVHEMRGGDLSVSSSGDYFSCRCSSGASYHTCEDCTNLRDLFDDLGRPESEDGMVLEDVLSRVRARSRSHSQLKKSHSAGDAGDIAAEVAAEVAEQEARASREEQTTRDGDVKTRARFSPTRLTKTEAGKKLSPEIHPEAEERLKKTRSRSRSLTKEIVHSYIDFHGRVTRSRSRSSSRHDSSADLIREMEERQRDDEEVWRRHQEAAAAYLLGCDPTGDRGEHLRGWSDPSRQQKSPNTRDDGLTGKGTLEMAYGKPDEERLPRDPERWTKEYLSQVEKEHQESLRREKDEEERMTREELSQSCESADLDELVSEAEAPEQSFSRAFNYERKQTPVEREVGPANTAMSASSENTAAATRVILHSEGVPDTTLTLEHRSSVPSDGEEPSTRPVVTLHPNVLQQVTCMEYEYETPNTIPSSQSEEKEEEGSLKIENRNGKANDGDSSFIKEVKDSKELPPLPPPRALTQPSFPRQGSDEDKLMWKMRKCMGSKPGVSPSHLPIRSTIEARLWLSNIWIRGTKQTAETRCSPNSVTEIVRRRLPLYTSRDLTCRNSRAKPLEQKGKDRTATMRWT